MNDSMEKILKDIYQLDPSLKDRDVEVRNIVKSLIAEKPAVTISESFTKSLRAELVSPPVVASKATPKNTAWWMFYLAPVGVAAIVLFMIAPYSNGPDVQNTLPTISGDEAFDTYQYNDDNQGARKQAPAMESSFMMNAESGDAMEGVQEIVVMAQVPGRIVMVESASLSTPGFVVIHKDDEGEFGEVIGVSSVLPSGPNYQMSIPLRTPTNNNGSYYAVLYFDNGNGVFEPGLDLPTLTNSDGLPIHQYFSAMFESSI